MPASGVIPIFVLAESPGLLSSAVPVSAYSSAQSGVFAHADVYAWADWPQVSIPVFAKNEWSSAASGRLPVFADGESYRASAVVEVFAENTQTLVTNSATVYASGYGRVAGSTPFEGSLPVMAHRPVGAVLDVYVQGPGGVPSGGLLPVFARGFLGVSLSADVSVPEVRAVTASGMTVYSHGW